MSIFIHPRLDIVYAFYLVFQFWSHRHLYKDSKQKSNRLSVTIPINPRFIPPRRIFSGDTLKTSRSETESLRWKSSATGGSKIGMFPGMSSRLSLHSPSETTLTTSSFTVPINAEKTIDSKPTVRLVTQALKDYGTEGSSGSSPLSQPESRAQSMDEVSTKIEDDNSNTPPEPANIDMLPPHDQRSTLSNEPFKEPKLSLTLTLFLLTVVTIVSVI